MTYTLRFLAEARFVSFVRWLEGSGGVDGEAGVEATLIATLRHPEAGDKPFYVKIYPDEEGRSRGLANEITGYVLANRFGLPQPETACVIRAPLKNLQLAQAPRRHAWLRELARTRQTYPAFCTQAMQAPTPWHHYGGKVTDALRNDLRKWPDAAKAMAFDEIITNLDRNLRNLLRVGAGQYALIDHGRLVTPTGHWDVADLDPTLRPLNRLLEILYDNPAIAANAMVAAAEHSALLLTGMHEIRHWLTHLLPPPLHSAFHDFLQKRTISAPATIAARYALC